MTLVGKKNLIYTQNKTDTKKEIEDALKKKVEKKEFKPIVTQDIQDGPSDIQPVILEVKISKLTIYHTSYRPRLLREIKTKLLIYMLLHLSI